MTDDRQVCDCHQFIAKRVMFDNEFPAKDVRLLALLQGSQAKATLFKGASLSGRVRWTGMRFEMAIQYAGPRDRH
jgi:hypothetical protein